MKTLYLDHHILVNEDHWPILRGIVEQGIATLAISSWNLVEIEQATNHAQKERRVDFVASLSPVYVHDMITLQRYEVRSFAWLYYFYAGLYPYRAFVPTFAAYLRANFGFRVRDDYTLNDYFRNARQEYLAPIAARQGEMALALQTLQRADRRKLAQIDEETFSIYLASRLPKFTPDGTLVDQDMVLAMTKFCYGRRMTLNRLSPAVFAEEELGIKRRENATRRPSRSDAADLMHCTVGISHCDAFVTNDGFAFRCCEHAKAILVGQNVRSANLFLSLQEFVAAV